MIFKWRVLLNFLALCFSFAVWFSAVELKAEVGPTQSCTALKKPVKYKVKKGDHLASILRYFGLDPVFCRGCSLERLLRLNQIQNQNLIEIDDLLTVPFLCEENLSQFKTEDMKDYRLIDAPREVATSKNWQRTDKVVIPVMNKNQTEPKTGFVHFKEVKNVAIENGVNDWSKIDCQGVLRNNVCFEKISSHYLKLKNSILQYDFEDQLRNESYSMNSYLTPGFELGWIHFINKSWSILTDLEVNFENIKTSRYQTKQSKYAFIKGLIDLRFHPFDSYWGVGLRWSENPYVYPTGTSIDIEAINQLSIRALAGYYWFETREDLLRSEFSIDYSGAVSGHQIEPKPSHLFNLKNEYLIMNPEGYFLFGLDLSRHEQNSSNIHQAYWGLIGSIGIGWDLKSNF